MQTRHDDSLSPCDSSVFDGSNEVDSHYIEIGMDEVARGSFFGRAYVAAVVLPEPAVDFSQIKDSKKFSSRTKREKIAHYIKSIATAWHVEFVEAAVIDELNIREAILLCMQNCVLRLIEQHGFTDDQIHILVDGNYFAAPTDHPNWKYTTVVQGDQTFYSIAAASILAKVAHDNYILGLCSEQPELSEKYHLHTNMGYGTQQHRDGIKEFGLTPDHRRSFRSKEEKQKCFIELE
jgi:ribonuclease HII